MFLLVCCLRCVGFGVCSFGVLVLVWWLRCVGSVCVLVVPLGSVCVGSLFVGRVFVGRVCVGCVLVVSVFVV